MTYYIYHIKGKKIGVTNNLNRRVEKQQGCNDYEVLYQTDNIDDVSRMELELQKKYNYKLDSKTYKEMTQLHITNKTITFKNDSPLPNRITLKDGTIIEVNSQVKNFISNNIRPSIDPSGSPFIYIEPLKQFYQNLDSNSMFDLIRSWASKKGIIDDGDQKTQYIKLQEEAGELAKAILNQNQPEIIDAVGDIVVVLTSLSELSGFSIEDAIESAYNEIANRTGSMKNGTFVKD